MEASMSLSPPAPPAKRKRQCQPPSIPPAIADIPQLDGDGDVSFTSLNTSSQSSSPPPPHAAITACAYVLTTDIATDAHVIANSGVKFQEENML
jgi:hypothetical protein